MGFFNAAVGEWFAAQTDGVIADYLLDPEPACAQLFDRREVAALVAEHREGANAHVRHTLLAVLMLEVWLSEYLPRALAHDEPQERRTVVA